MVLIFGSLLLLYVMSCEYTVWSCWNTVYNIHAKLCPPVFRIKEAHFLKVNISKCDLLGWEKGLDFWGTKERLNFFQTYLPILNATLWEGLNIQSNYVEINFIVTRLWSQSEANCNNDYDVLVDHFLGSQFLCILIDYCPPQADFVSNMLSCFRMCAKSLVWPPGSCHHLGSYHSVIKWRQEDNMYDQEWWINDSQNSAK